MEDIIMKRNNIIKMLAASVLCLIASGCSDKFLQTYSPNEVSSSTFWQNENDALMALTACYDAMQSPNLYDDNIDGWCFGFLGRETCTDNGDHTWGDWMLGSTISECASSTKDEHFSMYWNANYELVKRCNLVVDNVESVPMDEAKVKNIKAEAIALRALAYCNLVSVFRDVPYLEHCLTMAEAEAPKTLKAQIAESVIKDLNEWVPSLPSVGSQETGRMTREAGYAILGRMALFAGKWDNAISAYKNIIGKVSLFKSGDGTDYAANFADLFTVQNENASEVLLSVHYNGPGLGEGSCFGVCWGAPMNAIEGSMNLCDDFYCTDGLPIDKSPLFKGSLEKGAHQHDAPDYARYENRDPRMSGTLFLPGEYWNGLQYPQGAGWFPATSTCCIRKWYTPWDTANEYDGSLDFYVIRYAEVLLSLAEALIESGAPQAECTKYINEVRARVGMPSVEEAEGTGLSQAELRAVVRHERRVELAFEDLRFADLYRWGEFAEAQKRMQHDADFYGFCCVYRGTPRAKGQDIVWPIPQGEIDTNSKLEQHDEWK